MTQHSILIIDDEANQRLMIEQALRIFNASWIITTASNGDEALELVRYKAPDLIITDYNMPGMNGLDIIAQIRQHGLASHIILMTAYSSGEITEAARNFQIDHYITKPVPVSHLRQITAMTLNRIPCVCGV